MPSLGVPRPRTTIPNFKRQRDRAGLQQFDYVLTSNPLDKFARWGAYLSVLPPRCSGDLRGNISRHIARPALVRIESDNAQNALVFTPENALDNGLLVGPEFVYLAPRATVLTEVLEERRQSDREWELAAYHSFRKCPQEHASPLALLGS
jgi:hypothetical protein